MLLYNNCLRCYGWRRSSDLLCTRRGGGVAPARGKPEVLSMPLRYLSRVSQYILHGSGETPSS